MPDDPIGRVRAWYRRAQRFGSPQPEAMAVATADARGTPSLRFVLLKQIDARGFVFFTDARSRKGRELAARPRAAATLYWSGLGRQVRIEGRVERLPAGEADAYWQTRPRASQLSAASSHQSAPLGDRAVLVARRDALARRLRGQAVPRPPEWSGFRIVPDAIELWTHRDDRLHHREVYRRTRAGWRRALLQP